MPFRPTLLVNPSASLTNRLVSLIQRIKSEQNSMVLRNHFVEHCLHVPKLKTASKKLKKKNKEALLGMGELSFLSEEPGTMTEEENYLVEAIEAKKTWEQIGREL